MNLIGKKILFLAPEFFGYEDKIREKMIELGAVVDFYSERSISRNYEKALLKISPDLFYFKTLSYYKKVIVEVSKYSYDFILIIKCEMIPVEMIKKLKDMNSNSVLCLYLFDSLNNIKKIKRKLPYFDRIVSFDYNDCKNNSKFVFRPLFFLDEYSSPIYEMKDQKYDISFIGTVHSDRYRILNSIKTMASQNNLTFFFYLYLQSKFMFFFYKIFNKDFSRASINEFQFHPLSSTEIRESINETKVVIDIQHPNQTGLTMRTIEMIGMHKKLITTNKNIKYYDFYNSNNICIVDRSKVEIPGDFFILPYQYVDKKIYDKYSLQNWIFEVLGVKDEK